MSDGRTVQRRDFVEADHVRRQYTGSTMYLMADPQQQFYYMSKQSQNDVLIFKNFDSKRDVEAPCELRNPCLSEQETLCYSLIRQLHRMHHSCIRTRRPRQRRARASRCVPLSLRIPRARFPLAPALGFIRGAGLIDSWSYRGGTRKESREHDKRRRCSLLHFRGIVRSFCPVYMPLGEALRGVLIRKLHM